MSWTDERIDQLKAMWERGLTASQIADELGGVSRNAVIGKAHRLGLKSRPSPVKANEKKKAAPAKPKPAPKPAAKKAAPKPAAPKPAAPAAPAQPTTPPASRQDASPSQPMPNKNSDLPKIVSVGPGGLLRQGPARAAAPPGAGQAQPRDRRQDQLARPVGQGLPLADGPSRRARLPFLR